jgi:hypothetical protein
MQGGQGYNTNDFDVISLGEVSGDCMPWAHSRQRNRRGLMPHPEDNILVSFDQFFNLMSQQVDASQQIGDDGQPISTIIEFEQTEKNVSCFLFPIFY